MLTALAAWVILAGAAPAEPDEPRKLDSEQRVKAPRSFATFDPGEGFAVKAPGKPQVHRELAPAPGGDAAVVMYEFTHDEGPCADETKPCVLLVGWIRYPAALVKKLDVERGLDGGRNAMVERAGGDLVSEDRVTLGGAPGREIVFRILVPKPLGALQARVRLFFRGDTLFVVQLLAPTDIVDSAPNRAFLTSFRWTPPRSNDKKKTP